jgi:hypothetical protein
MQVNVFHENQNVYVEFHYADEAEAVKWSKAIADTITNGVNHVLEGFVAMDAKTNAAVPESIMDGTAKPVASVETASTKEETVKTDEETVKADVADIMPKPTPADDSNKPKEFEPADAATAAMNPFDKDAKANAEAFQKKADEPAESNRPKPNLADLFI